MSWRALFEPAEVRLTRAKVWASYSIAAGALAGVVGLALAGCHARRAVADDLRATAVVPDEAPIEIHFDRPAGGAPIGAGDLAIEPRVSWRATWRDAQTLSIETGALAPSTRYRIALRGDLARRTGGFALAFVHRPIAVEGVWGVDAQALAPDGALPLSFNVPVDPRDAAAHCRLGAVALRVVPGADAIATDIALVPEAPLEAGARYTLVCDGLAGARGDAVLARPYSLALRVRPAAAVAKVEPAGEDVAPDETQVRIAFATPVSLAAVRAALSSSPAIAALRDGALSSDGLEYAVTVDLEASTHYQIRVGALVDRFGQRAAEPAVHDFRTGAARPRIAMARGAFAVEAAAAGLPVWSRGVGAFAVECAQIPRDRLAQVLASEPVDDGTDGERAIDWRAYRAAPHTTAIEVGDRGAWRLHELDLGAACGAGPGARGVYLAEVRSDEIVADPREGWLAPRRHRVLANVTDLGVLAKLRGASGLVWVTSLATGEPVAGARVSLVRATGEALYADLTSADGLVKVPGAALRAERIFAIVEKGADVAILDGAWAEDSAEPAPRDGDDARVPRDDARRDLREDGAGRDPAVNVAQRARTIAPRPGERLAFDLDARDALGAPLAGARVTWVLRARTHAIRFARWPDYNFGAVGALGALPAARDDSRDLVADGTVATDAHGRAAIAARDPATTFAGPIDYALETTVTDAAERATRTTTIVTAHPVAAYLGVRVAERVQDARAPFDVELVAVDPEGASIAARARVSLLCTGEAGAIVVDEREVELAAAGARTERFALPMPGDYTLRIETTDARGVLVVVERALAAVGAADAVWSGGDSLLAGRSAYEPGQTAHLAPRANLAASTALVTVERDGVLDARVAHLGASGEGLELAVAAAWAPGVSIDVALAAGRRGAGDANRPRLALGETMLGVGGGSAIAPRIPTASNASRLARRTGPGRAALGDEVASITPPSGRGPCRSTASDSPSAGTRRDPSR